MKKIRFPETSGIGVKPVSREGTQRLVRKAIQYAIDNDKPSVTLVHKGNIMKFTEGAFATGATAGAPGVRRRADRRRPPDAPEEPAHGQGDHRQDSDCRRLPAADFAASGRDTA